MPVDFDIEIRLSSEDFFIFKSKIRTMKLLPVVFLLVLSCCQLAAQEASEPVARDWLVGGAVQASFSNDDLSSTTIGISPLIGKYVRPHLIVGGSLNYLYRDSEGFFLQSNLSQEFITMQSTYGVGIFLRYLTNPQNRLTFYLQPAINYSYSRATTESFETVIFPSPEPVEILRISLFDTYAFTVGVGLGLQYQIAERWQTRVNYGGFNYVRQLSHNPNAEGTTSSDMINLNLNFSSFSLAFEYRI